MNGLGRGGMPGTYYAASEWGGIFKTTDGGDHWKHLIGHLPQATWDVEVAPGVPEHVYATSFYDGKVGSVAGINISDDGGGTWTPAFAKPPERSCRLGPKGGRDFRRAEPSAFGIAIDPANSATVYIGTNCGLAKSTDHGEHWTFIDPSQPDGLPKAGGSAVTVWDVVVAHGNVDVCGEGGHQRLASGSTTWETADVGHELTAGRCSIAASPDEPNVLFVAVGLTVYETTNGGKRWSELVPVNPPPPPGADVKKTQGRIPFVATNKTFTPNTLAQKTYDLYYGDENLWRVRCVTPAISTDPRSRCFKISVQAAQEGAHGDVGDLAFARGPLEDCPALFSNDGGVFHNTSPQCRGLKWAQATETTNALWAWGLAGLEASATSAKRLYFGSQDNGLFVTSDARADTPTWSAAANLDIYDVTVNANRLVYLSFKNRDKPYKKIFIANLGGGNRHELNNYPDGDVITSSDGSVIANFAGNNYAVVTDKGVFVTKDIDPPVPVFSSQPKVEWRRIGRPGAPLSVQEIQVGMTGNTPTPTFYVLGDARAEQFYASNIYNNDAEPRYAGVFKHVGTGEGDTPPKPWEEVKPDEDFNGFGIFAVDPNNPERLIASQIKNYHLGTELPPKAAMFRSWDGGKHWAAMPELDRMMAGSTTSNVVAASVAFNSANENGPTRNSWFFGYPQPTLIKFDPADPNIIVAGGADSGVFISYDDGANWTLLTAGQVPTAIRPHIPRPRFAHFDHVTGTKKINLFIGSQGRGLWRIELLRP